MAQKGLLYLLFDQAAASPYLSALITLSVMCLGTRVYTSLKSTITSGVHVDGDKEVGILPYWTPWLGHVFSFGARFQTFLTKATNQSKDGVFGILVAGTKQNVVTAPSLVRQVLSVHAPVENRDFVYYLMENFWGDQGAIRAMDPDVVFGSIHRVLYQLNRDPFVANAISTAVKILETKTYELISFNASPVDQSPWERSAQVTIPSPRTAEANMNILVRDFVGDIACRLLMGHNFIENNPNVLADLWLVDSKLHYLMLGLPSWTPGTGLAEATAARDRLKAAVAELHEALFATLEGRDPGPRWDDLSDVSNVVMERAKAWREHNAPANAYGAGDATLLWAMMVNANQVIFWLLWHTYSSPSLLSELRSEMSPFVRTVSPEKTGLPIEVQPVLKLDMDGLMKQCPLLQATFLETMRMNAYSSTFKKVEKDFSVMESVEDAHNQGKSQPQSFNLSRGEMICIPHSVHQNDERYWDHAQTFDPTRFLVKKHLDNIEEKGEEGESDEKQALVDYKTMRVWGGGPTVCKGQRFAEREVIAFAAAILNVWDIEPIGKKGWKHPGHKGTAGTAVPKMDVRVKMQRRL